MRGYPSVKDRDGKLCGIFDCDGETRQGVFLRGTDGHLRNVISLFSINHVEEVPAPMAHSLHRMPRMET